MYAEYRCPKCGRVAGQCEELSDRPYMKCKCGASMVFIGNEDDD